MVFLFNQSKPESLISLIEDKVNLTIKDSENKSRWTLYIMTCYITINGLDDLFKSLEKSFEQNDISKVKILADKDEWAKLFFFKKENVLEERLKKLKNININISDISIKPVDSEKLFHAKSYALVNDEFEGFVISTSANLTERGLNTNLEFGNFVQNSTHLNKQYVSLFSKIEEKVLPENDRRLREIAEAELILSMGSFYIDRNDIDIICSKAKSKEAISVRRNVVPNEPQSISYRLVDHIAIKNLLPPLIPPNLIKFHSIETIIGRWIPKEVDRLIIEKRKKVYGEAYIEFMKDNYFNRKSIEQEIQMLTISIENNIKSGEIEFECNKEKFISDCIDKIKKAKFIDDDYSNSNDNDSILNIFFDYHKIQEVEFEEIPNNLKKVILKNIRKNLNEKNPKGYKLKTTVYNTSENDHLTSEDFKAELSTIANDFVNEEKLKIYSSVKKLEKYDIFSALISYYVKENKDIKKYRLLVGCIFESCVSIGLTRKDEKISAIKYHFQNIEHDVKSLLIDNIVLFKKFDSKEDISKSFFLPLLYIEQQLQKLIREFDENIAKKVLIELDYVLNDYDRKKFFLLALELVKSSDEDSNIEKFVLAVAYWYYGLQDIKEKNNVYGKKNLACDIKFPKLIRPQKFCQMLQNKK
jgi:hypothetical protein